MPRDASLKNLYIEQLKDLYSAEIFLIGVLPSMVQSASDSKLKADFDRHLGHTYRHVERIEQILDSLNENPSGHQCDAMLGLAKDGARLIRRDTPPAVKDAALVATAQRIEHYEIAGYNSVCAYALLLGDHQAAESLQATLSEELDTDAELTEMAQRINSLAAAVSWGR